MAIFAIGDLHLSLGGSKPMDIFPGWEGYLPKLEANWRRLIAPDDTVVRAVLALPPKYRQVVVLYYYRDCSTGEIARMLGVPQGTVSVRLKRARERLKPMLKEWYDEEG